MIGYMILSLILSLIVVSTLKYLAYLKRENKLLNIRNRELMEVYIKEREKSEEIRFTMELYKKIIELDMGTVKNIKTSSKFIQEKGNYYFLFYDDIYKFKFLMEQFNLKELKKIGLVVKYGERVLYVERELIKRANRLFLEILLDGGIIWDGNLQR